MLSGEKACLVKCFFYYLSFACFSVGVWLVGLKLGLGAGSYVASSTSGAWDPEKMRLGPGDYNGWLGDGSTPWISVDMQAPYTIVGFYLLRRNTYYLTSYNLKASVDGSNFAYIQEDIDTTTDFSNNALSSIYWFEQPTVGRHWVIEVVSVNERPYVKGDFIGYV